MDRELEASLQIIDEIIRRLTDVSNELESEQQRQLIRQTIDEFAALGVRLRTVPVELFDWEAVRIDLETSASQHVDTPTRDAAGILEGSNLRNLQTAISALPGKHTTSGGGSFC